VKRGLNSSCVYQSGWKLKILQRKIVKKTRKSMFNQTHFSVGAPVSYLSHLFQPESALKESSY